MPLLDHFRPPLSERRHWEGFHSRCTSPGSSEPAALQRGKKLKKLEIPGVSAASDVVASNHRHQQKGDFE